MFVLFIDKAPLKSKKFIFALFGVILFASVILAISFTQIITWPVAAVLVILAIGLMIIPVGYVLGQSAIDKVAAMVGSVSNMFGGKNGTIPDENME